jgi:hypothetical protein
VENGKGLERMVEFFRLVICILYMAKCLMVKKTDGGGKDTMKECER